MPGRKPPTDWPHYIVAESRTQPELMNCKINSMSPERWRALELLLKQQDFHPG